MAQRVKNPTVMAQVIVEVWVSSLTRQSGLKDPVLPQLQLGFNPWPGNLHMVLVEVGEGWITLSLMLLASQ